MADSERRYTTTAIVLHWLIAAAVAAQVALGWAMQAIPKQPPGLRADAFNLHKSIGLTLLALMVVRILWRLAHRPPPLPPMPRWQRLAAHANHALLYLLLVLLPLCGYLGSVWSGFPIRYFGVVLPPWGGKNDARKALMSELHLALGLVLVAAVALHVAAALRHAWVARDGLLARMWPATGRGRGAPANTTRRSSLQ